MLRSHGFIEDSVKPCGVELIKTAFAAYTNFKHPNA